MKRSYHIIGLPLRLKCRIVVQSSLRKMWASKPQYRRVQASLHLLSVAQRWVLVRADRVVSAAQKTVDHRGFLTSIPESIP